MIEGTRANLLLKPTVGLVCLLSVTLLAVADPAPSTPAPAAKPDAVARTKMGLKLAGLVAFVANSCPKLKPDYARFKTALGVLGLSVEALEKPDMKSGYLGYAAQYRADIPANCGRATEQFGPKGATIPGIFLAQ